MSKYIKLDDAIEHTNQLYHAYEVEAWLESLPTIEVSEDAISREDAVNALIAHFIPQTYTGEQVEQASKLAWKIMANAPSVIPTADNLSAVEDCTYTYCSRCGMRVVVNAPSIIPKPKEGEWIACTKKGASK